MILRPWKPRSAKSSIMAGVGLVDVEHGQGHDQVGVALDGLFDQVVAFAGPAEEADLVDVQPLAVVGEHVEHAVGGVDRQVRAARAPGVVDVGVEDARRRVLDVGGPFDVVHLY